MKVLIATPTMGSVDVRFFSSALALEKPCQCSFAVEDGSLVYMARNRLALKAIENEFDYVLWIDSDMVFPADTLSVLLKDAENGMDYVSALFFNRHFPTHPVICKEITTSDVTLYKNYPRDTVFEIAGSGLACTLVKASLMQDIAEVFYTSPFEPMQGLGEDYSFCYRAKRLGAKMYCDSRVKVGHVGKIIFNEDIYNGQKIEYSGGAV